MKLKELKHNHSLTDLLKILIFSVLMITPLLSVATRCLYVICNKNAYQSAQITQTTINNVLPEYAYETNEVNSANDLNTDYAYYMKDLTYTIDNLFTNNDGFLDITIYTGDISFNEFTFDDIDYDDYILTNQVKCIFYANDNVNIYFGDLSVYGVQTQHFEFTTNNVNVVLNQFYNVDYTIFSEATDLYLIGYDIEYSEVTTLDNVFEYSVNKLQESPIINWTANTGVYTGVNAMTTQLGIEGAVIPMLITYWFLLTIIYVIIDIVLKLFTVLTHLIGSKTT